MRSIRPAVLIHLGCLSLAAVLFAAGTAVQPASAPGLASVVVKDVPHVKQKPDFCGEACVEMWARKLGKAITQDQVFSASGLDPAQSRGCYTRELVQAVATLGFKPGTVWYKVDNAKMDDQLGVQFKALHDDLTKGIPSIVCMHYEDKPQTTEHFRLILGYDAKTDEVIYHEPAESGGAYKRMKRALFLKLWPLASGPGTSTAIRLRLEADKVRDLPVSEGFTDADYAQHVMALRKKMPAGFSLVIQKPFVVVGDEAPQIVQARAVSTVKWAVDRLKADYFKKDPAEILDIWLFKDKASYEKYTKEIFDDEPNTPYGYFSYTDKALIMNISTGGGTLVHEIVHPFMHTNFPECPPWFNEGMGSLYEQSAERGGHIIGLTNWRLAGLQKAIKANLVPSFEKLCAMDNNAFYEHDKGTNYGQSRYLCYYLQEKGLLVKYYQEFTANKKKDPTGYKTLMSVLDETDMDAFKKRWEKWVLTLTFP